ASLSDLLTLKYDFLRYSLAGTTLIGMACGLLGCFIILRGLSLFGDALGHAVLPGVMIGYLLGGRHFGYIFLGALVAGLIAAALVAWIPRVSRHRPDTAIGVVFTGLFGLGVAIMSVNQAGASGITTFLFGRALGIGPAEVAWAAGALVAVLLTVGLFYRQLKLLTFDPVQAVVLGLPVGALSAILMALVTSTVIVGLPVVGAVLVVALLVIPGATAYLLVGRFGPMLLIATIVGGLSAVGGLALSHLFGWASGAAIVLASAGFFGLALLAQWLRRSGRRLAHA
ncbi:MAG: metal ABC transporter permease, partial [Candidatus Sericytochromatia bacterium]